MSDRDFIGMEFDESSENCAKFIRQFLSDTVDVYIIDDLMVYKLNHIRDEIAVALGDEFMDDVNTKICDYPDGGQPSIHFWRRR
jgi:hypothetical protein